MEINIYSRIKQLNEYEKVFLAHKIFDFWLTGKIINKDILVLPSDVKVNNSLDVSKVLLICSKMNKCSEVDEIMGIFNSSNFVEKLDIMVFLFDKINELKVIPNYITDTMNFKNLSEEIKKISTNI